MKWGNMIGKRDNYVVATIGTETENQYGDITDNIDSSRTVEFWAGVTDQKSDRTFSEGKRYDNTMKTLLCDSRDVDALTIDHEIMIDNRPTVFSIIDIYDSDFKFETKVIIKAQN